MAPILYMMVADYGTDANDGNTIYSTDLAALRLFGSSHHATATIKPTLRIYKPCGAIVTQMTEWDSVWQDEETGS